MEKKVSDIKRELALQHPMNAYPTMVGVVCGASYFLLDAVAAVGIVGIVAGAIGLGSLIINSTIRSDAFSNKAMAKLNTMRENQRVLQLMELESKLQSELTRNQLDRIRQKHHTFKDVLNERFTAGTITYNRFLGTAEDIFLLSIKRIEEIHLKEKQQAGIDIDHCTTRLRTLDRLKTPSVTETQEQTSLRARSDISKKITIRINEILALNEQAVTTFDVVMDQMSESACSETELSYLMEELESVSKVIGSM